MLFHTTKHYREPTEAASTCFHRASWDLPEANGLSWDTIMWKWPPKVSSNASQCESTASQYTSEDELGHGAKIFENSWRESLNSYIYIFEFPIIRAPPTSFNLTLRRWQLLSSYFCCVEVFYKPLNYKLYTVVFEWTFHWELCSSLKKTPWTHSDLIFSAFSFSREVNLGQIFPNLREKEFSMPTLQGPTFQTIAKSSWLWLKFYEHLEV